MAIIGIVEDNIKIRDLIQRYLDMQEDMDCPVAKDSVEEMLEYLEKHTVNFFNRLPDCRQIVDRFNRLPEARSRLAKSLRVHAEN